MIDSEIFPPFYKLNDFLKFGRSIYHVMFKENTHSSIIKSFLHDFLLVIFGLLLIIITVLQIGDFLKSKKKAQRGAEREHKLKL
jgi:hypothetical protein